MAECFPRDVQMVFKQTAVSLVEFSEQS